MAAKDFEHSESGNWNVAESWSSLMIFKPFKEASEYLTMAKNGCSDIYEEFTFDEEIKIRTRISALKWARDKVEEGINQSLFAVNKGDAVMVNKLLKELMMLNEILEGQEKSPIESIEKRINNGYTYKISIDEEMFKIVYNCIKRIFREVLLPLNRSDLIFMYKERFDPKQIKDQIKEDFINIG